MYFNLNSSAKMSSLDASLLYYQIRVRSIVILLQAWSSPILFAASCYSRVQKAAVILICQVILSLYSNWLSLLKIFCCSLAQRIALGSKISDWGHLFIGSLLMLANYSLWTRVNLKFGVLNSVKTVLIECAWDRLNEIVSVYHSCSSFSNRQMVESSCVLIIIQIVK